MQYQEQNKVPVYISIIKIACKFQDWMNLFVQGLLQVDNMIFGWLIQWKKLAYGSDQGLNLFWNFSARACPLAFHLIATVSYAETTCNILLPHLVSSIPFKTSIVKCESSLCFLLPCLEESSVLKRMFCFLHLECSLKAYLVFFFLAFANDFFFIVELSIYFHIKWLFGWLFWKTGACFRPNAMDRIVSCAVFSMCVLSFVGVHRTLLLWQMWLLQIPWRVA